MQPNRITHCSPDNAVSHEHCKTYYGIKLKMSCSNAIIHCCFYKYNVHSYDADAECQLASLAQRQVLYISLTTLLYCLYVTLPRQIQCQKAKLEQNPRVPNDPDIESDNLVKEETINFQRKRKETHELTDSDDILDRVYDLRNGNGQKEG